MKEIMDMGLFLGVFLGFPLVAGFTILTLVDIFK